MNFSKIKTIEQYDNAINRLIEIFHAEPNTTEDQEATKLQKLISEYESQNIETENKEDIIEFEITAHLYNLYIEEMAFMFNLEDSGFEQDYFIENKQNTEYKKLNRCFEREYNNYLENKKYFYGCPFDLYSKTYLERLEQFIKNYKDEFCFIESEFKKGVEYYPFSYFLNDNNKGKIETALRNRKKFLVEKLNKINYTINFTNLKERFESFEITETIKENTVKKELDYIQLGSLFAQGFIDKNAKNYNFKGQEITVFKEYSKLLSKEIENIDKVRQYIQATFNGTGEKNIYTKSKMKNIIDYCAKHQIKVTNEFQSIYTSFNI